MSPCGPGARACADLGFLIGVADAPDQAASPDVSTVPFGSLAREFSSLREVYQCCATEAVTNTIDVLVTG